MKVAISGASGFIGKALSKHFKRHKHTVSAIPREILGSPEGLEKFMKSKNPDYIIHCASYGNHSDHKDVDEIVTTNIVKTYFMLRASRDIPYKAFINIGSSSEYGRKDVPMGEVLVPETDTFYGASKVASTYLARAFAIQYDKPIVTVRPFSVYGEGDSDKHFIPVAVEHILNQKPMSLVAHSKHDWIYIDDFIDGIDTVIENIDKLKSNVINIGTGIQYSNTEVMEKLESILGKEAQVNVVKSMREYDNTSWVADNTFLRGLGWAPKYNLMTGLKKAYEKYKAKKASN